MNKSLTEHVQSEEFEKAVFQWAHDADGIKSHLLQSQLKIIELLKEELEDMEAPMELEFELESYHEGFFDAVHRAITLLDTIIQEIKSQMK